MNENEQPEQPEQPQTIQLSNSARVSFALRQGSDDAGFRLLMDSIGTLVQREHDDWKEQVRFCNPFALNFLENLLHELKLGDDHSGLSHPYYDRVIDHVHWLQNEAQGYARAQDLDQERFLLICRAAGITEPVPSYPDRWENLATVIREKCKADES
jgi:hypothetical protein